MRNLMIALAAAGALLLGCLPAIAQTTPAQTTPRPILITTGNTFQVALPSGAKRSMTIQNNNASDTCYLLVGGPWQLGDTTAITRVLNGVTIAASKASIVLTAGQSYARFFPFIPNDQILATCATTGSSLYVDYQ